MFSGPRLSLAALALALVGCGASQRMVHRGNAQFERCHSAELAEPVDEDAARACWEGFLTSHGEGQPTHRLRYARERIAALSRGETLRALPAGGPVELEIERTASAAGGRGIEVASSDASASSATPRATAGASDAPSASEAAATGGSGPSTSETAMTSVAAPGAPVAGPAPSPSASSSAAPVAPSPAPGAEPVERSDEAPPLRTPRYRGDPTCEPVCGPPWNRCIARCGEGRMPCVVACENEYRACMQGCF